MIERRFVAEKLKEFHIQEFIRESLKNAGFSHSKFQKTPLGEKILVYTSHPGLVVGRKGENIKRMTEVLKEKFNLENPQIEIAEVDNPNLDAAIVAEKIASALERFGLSKFKAIGHKAMTDVMGDGALGIEVMMSGKIPSARAKAWRFYQGYLKKCGDIAIVGIRRAYANALLKTGIIGVQVRIMPPDIKLPDHVELLPEKQEIAGEVKEEKPITEVPKEEKPKEEAKEAPAKKPRKASRKKKEEKDEGKGPEVNG